jgi:ribonucleoside-diphosphate reductase alpha chain
MGGEEDEMGADGTPRPATVSATKVVSHGFTRGKLAGRIMPRDGAETGNHGSASTGVATLQRDVATAFASPHANALASSTALSTPLVMGNLALSSAPLVQTKSAPRRDPGHDPRTEAKAKGYGGEACGECGNFTLVRNGTCMKCDTCGGTSGCS